MGQVFAQIKLSNPQRQDLAPLGVNAMADFMITKTSSYRRRNIAAWEATG